MWLFGVTFFLDMACQADLRQFIFFLLAAHSILGVAFRFFWAYPRRQDLKFSKLIATQSGIQTALVPQMPGYIRTSFGRRPTGSIFLSGLRGA